jgi:ankyrin repeat protein
MKRFLLFSLLCAAPAFAQDIDIFDAARKGNIAQIQQYAKKGGDIDAVNESGYTPFILATYNAQDKAAAELLKAGADACATDKRGSNSYMGVAYQGHVHTAKWLLENTRCDINHQNHAGQTALMMAALFDREEIIKLFLAHKADPAIKDFKGNTAESLAKAQGLTNVINLVRFPLQ